MNEDVPLWIEKYGKYGGRDHLGLQSVGQSMLDELTFGLSNITRRLSYYPFYCYVIKSFFDSVYEKTYSNYLLHLNKLSFLYTLSMSSVHLNEANSGIDGIEFARRNLPNIFNGTKIITDEFFYQNEYRNNNWIYKAKLDNLRMTTLADNTQIPSLIDPFGKELANCFEQMVKDTIPDVIDFNKLTQQQLENLEEKWCYHRIKNNENLRNLLEDILFARVFPEDTLQCNRRYTLALILYFIDTQQSHRLLDFQKWVYKNQALPDNMKRIKYFWQLLFARNYLVYSLESLFLYFLYNINNIPLSFPEFFDTLDKDIRGSGDILGKLSTYYDQPIKQVMQSIYTTSQVSVESELYEPNLIIPLESIKNHINTDTSKQFLHNSILCLLSLYNRYSFNQEKQYTVEEKIFMEQGSIFRLSLSTFFDSLDDALYENKSIKEFIEELYETQLIPRHQLIASEKLYVQGLDTFHFQFQDNRYHEIKRRDPFQPTLNAMKFSEILNILEDLDLIDRLDTKQVKITNRGKSIVNEFYE